MSEAPLPPTALQSRGQPASLADVLDRVLDKGLVIAGDIGISLLDVEVLTIKVRLILVSADKAEELGIDWWRNDPHLSSVARGAQEENRQLRERIAELESRVAELGGDRDGELDTDGGEPPARDSRPGDEGEPETDEREPETDEREPETDKGEGGRR